MIRDIIKALSDTELMVIADELSKDVPLEYVIRQLISKSNNGEQISTDDEKEILEELAFELSKRLDDLHQST